jgi:uncharacterized protein
MTMLRYRPLAIPTALLYAFVILLCGCDKKEEAAPTKQEESPQPAKDTQPNQAQIIGDLIKKAQLGDVTAQLELGKRYTDGDAIEKDATKGFEWLEKASQQGNQEAEYLTGRAFSKGKGVERDVQKAFLIFSKLNDKGNPSGMGALGVAYLRGEGTEKNEEKGLSLLQRAAALGDSHSQANLGVLYSLGKVVTKNDQLAVSWYKKGVEQGNAHAQTLLGYAYYLGEGTPKNAAMAFELYSKAASQGDETAQQLLADMYQSGVGTPVDSVLAYAWANIAAANGDANALKFRNAVETKLSQVERDEAERLSTSWRKGVTLKREEWETIGAAKDASRRNSSDLKKASTGTAFVVTNDGKAITNQHVVNGCTELRVQGKDGVSKLVVEDIPNDLALVHIPGDFSNTAIIVAEPSKLKQGDDIVVFGFPLNAVLSSSGNLTPGTVSALSGIGNNTNQIQVTASIQPGSSGSPIMNKTGEVVGVVSRKLDDAKLAKFTGQLGQNVNFAVSAQTLKSFLDIHKVSYTNGASIFARELTASAVADEARKWTFVIECWK